MSVFEGKAWISKQGLVDVCIEGENGYISSVKKTSLESKKEKAQSLGIPLIDEETFIDQYIED